MIRHIGVICLMLSIYCGNCKAWRDPFTASAVRKKSPVPKIKLINVVLSQTENCCSVAGLQVAEQKQIVQIGDLVLSWRVSQITPEKVVLTSLDDSLVFKELLVADLLV